MKSKISNLMYVLVLLHFNASALNSVDEEVRQKYGNIFGFISIVIPAMERVDIKCKTNIFDEGIKEKFDILFKNKTGLDYNQWLEHFADIRETENKINQSITSILENTGGCRETALKAMNIQIEKKLMYEHDKMALFRQIKLQ